MLHFLLYDGKSARRIFKNQLKLTFFLRFVVRLCLQGRKSLNYNYLPSLIGKGSLINSVPDP